MTFRIILWVIIPFAAAAGTTFVKSKEKDEFVVVLNSYSGFEARIAAGRANRLGLQTVVVTNGLSEGAAEIRKAENEIWLPYEGTHLEAMAAFVAYRHLGDSFKWMFLAEDDTLFFRQGARNAVQGTNESLAYAMSDAAWFISHEGLRHYLRAEAPQCVPCSYAKNMSLLPDHFVRGCPCSIKGTQQTPDGFCGPQKMPSMEYFPHGGPGYLLSIGLLQKISFQDMERCLTAEENADFPTCLWKLGIGITDPDPIWHPERLTHFDPTPPPFLTHENIMEKTAYILGKLMRQATGMCTDICQEEVGHLISLHVNAARIGFTKTGEKRVGDFKDAGQREFTGTVLLGALARYYARDVLQPGLESRSSSGGFQSLLEGRQSSRLEKKVDGRLAAAKEVVRGMGSVFQVDMLGEGEVHRGLDPAAKLTTTERARTAIAMAIARQAMDIIVRDCAAAHA